MRTGIVFCAVLLLGLATPWPQQTQQKPAGIRVQLNYTGSGTVDAKHKIYVALWDTPDFLKPDAQVMPVAVESTDSKKGVVTFTNVQKSPAYVSAAFDTSGQWDGKSGPPPKGASVGMVATNPLTPEPINITPGKTNKVKLTFDDSKKMM